jgi:hypothetical protein
MFSPLSSKESKLSEILTFKWHRFELRNPTEISGNNWGMTKIKYTNMVRKCVYKFLKCLLLYINLLRCAAQYCIRLCGHHTCKPSTGASIGVPANSFPLSRSGNLPKRFMNVDVYIENLFETRTLQDLRYSQQCLWRVLSPLMWRHNGRFRRMYCSELRGRRVREASD